MSQIPTRDELAALDAADAFIGRHIAPDAAGIADMLAYDGPVMVDCRVAKLANCFPMIPSGAAHNEMILGAAQSGQAAGITEEGMMLV